MGLLVPNIDRKIANLQEGEIIIGINAREGEECSSSEDMALKICVRLVLDDTLSLEELEAEVPKIQYLRCGWIERPAPDTPVGIHDAPLGKLWIVYKRATETEKSMPAQTA